jgi:hypothetical protein
MSEHAFKVGPIQWRVRNAAETFGWAGGFMKGEIKKATITGWGVWDTSGSFSRVSQGEEQTGDLARLVGVGAMAQLLVAHEPQPGKKKLITLNLDFSQPECSALVDELKRDLGHKFVGMGGQGEIRKKLGVSSLGPIIGAVVVLAAVAGVIVWFAF